MRITEEYRAANKRLHEINKKYGTSGAKWAKKVASIVRTTDSQTILDYGCGKGLLAAALPELHIREYDPAISGKDREPGPADLIVCTDVLEHIEPDCLDSVLAHICDLTLKYAFLNVSTRPAVKFLEDGRNAHLIIQPADWWRVRLERYFTLVEWSPVEANAVNTLARPR